MVAMGPGCFARRPLSAPVAPAAVSCGGGCCKDTDCKGARICVAHACVDPSPAATPSPAPISPLAPIFRSDADGGVLDYTPPLSRDPSPMFHGNALHTGASRFAAPFTRPKEQFSTVTEGAIVSSPALAADGTAIFGSHDHAIYAVNKDGTLRWRHLTGDLVWASPALSPDGTVVYVGSDDDQLYALDLTTGQERWHFLAGPCRTSVGVGPEQVRCDVDGVTVGADGTIYASADGLYALAPDGTLRWKFSPGNTHCADAAAVGPDGTAYLGCQDDAIYAIDRSGKKRWEFRTGDDVDGPPVLGPDGTLYVGSDDHKLYALGPAGVLRWALVTGGAIRSSPALAADGTLYVGSLDGALYAVRPNGQVAFTFRSADRILGSPLVDKNGVVLFGSEDDRLYALDRSGRLLWSVLLDGDIDSTPVLDAAGSLYFGSDDKALHVLR